MNCSVCRENGIDREAVGCFASALGPFSQNLCQECFDGGKECMKDVDYILYPEKRLPKFYQTFDMGPTFLKRATYYKEHGSFIGYDVEKEFE